MKVNTLESKSNRLKFYFERRGVSKNDSEDLVQEVFYKILRAGKDIESVGYPYLYCSARSVLINSFRRGKNDPLNNVLEGHEAVDEFVLVDNDYTPDYLGHENQLLNKVNQKVCSLTQLQQNIFFGYFLSDCTMKDIAGSRNVTVSSVEKIISKVRVNVSVLLMQSA